MEMFRYSIISLLHLLLHVGVAHGVEGHEGLLDSLGARPLQHVVGPGGGGGCSDIGRDNQALAKENVHPKSLQKGSRWLMKALRVVKMSTGEEVTLCQTCSI